jgi:hypothetical protein
MPAERVAKRQASEIIRLKLSANVPTREIARRLGLALRRCARRSSVSKPPGYAGRCRKAWETASWRRHHTPIAAASGATAAARSQIGPPSIAS